LHTPSFDAETAAKIAAEHFGIRGDAGQLPSERDQNFLITNSAGEKFVLKIANALEEPAFVEAQNAVLKHLAKRISYCQRVVPTSSGEEIITVQGSGDARHLVRMVNYIDGVPIARVSKSRELLFDFGRKLGKLDRALADFDHPAVHRDFHWDLANGNRILEEYGEFIDDPELRELARTHRVTFDSELRRSVIHGDANDYNVLVDPERKKVVGIIDFGDMVYSYTVGNLAVAIAYVALENFRDGSAVFKYVMTGYRGEFSLTRKERAMVRQLVITRWLMSFCLSAYQQKQRPDNEYLSISQQAIRAILSKFLNADRRG
jgi:Ser/Thr protein kinase RdoA (MazF antagonist)